MKHLLLILLLLIQVAAAQNTTTWDSSRGATVTLQTDVNGRPQRVTIKEMDGRTATHAVKVVTSKTFNFKTKSYSVRGTFSGKDEISLRAIGVSRSFRWTRRGGQAKQPVPNTSTCARTAWLQGEGGSMLLLLSSPEAVSIYVSSGSGKRSVHRSVACEWVEYPHTFREGTTKLVKLYNPWLLKRGAIPMYRYHKDYKTR